MNEEDIRAQLEAEYDRVIKDTLRRLYSSKPLNRAKITAALMAANKTYWTARLALLDTDAVFSAGRVSGALAMSYYYAAEDLAEQVQHVYAGYRSAFHLSQKGAKELLDKVVYDRPIAESLQRIADAMPAGEEKNRILAEISAPAYRYRMQRAEQIVKNAQEACENIARGEIAIDRQFLQTEIEKAYNISLDGALSEPPSGEIADMLSGDVVLDRPVPAQPLEMPRADEPVQDFTPTDDRGIMDSFSVVSTDHAREIMENRWSGESFSERIWSNTEDLAQEVKQVILEGELTGASEAKMAAKIRDRFTVGMHEARRVVRTEHNYCINQAELKGMKDAGFDEYEFASLGENADDVCHTCDDLDGERFKIEDAVVGVNCPPMHPFCRCKATTPMETKEDVQADIDRMLDGRSIEDIERELDRQIAEQNALPENTNNDSEPTQPDNFSTLNSAQESAEENLQKMLTGDENGGIMERKVGETADNDVHYICEIDLEKYEKAATKPIITNEVVLTDNQADHIIKQRGQDFFDKFSGRFGEVVSDPDYVMKDKDKTRINTAVAAKAFYEEGKVVNVVVSLAVEGDNPSHKNSIITAIGQSEKRFKQTLRNNPPVYIKALDKNE